jgi:Immune inhibitor A peptidase M6
VTVSVDGGRTYTPVAGDKTVNGPLGAGLNGSSGEAFVPLRYNLSAYAGKRVLLGFRYVTDGSVNDGGWSIKDITLGGRPVSSEATDYRSPTQVRPTLVYAMHATLVGMNAGRVRQVPVTEWPKLRGFGKVVAIVAYDEPTETIGQYAPYTLTVNGVRQPG